MLVWKFSFSTAGCDVEEGAERAADGVVDHDVGLAELALDRGGGRVDLQRIGHVAADRPCAPDFGFELAQPLGIARQHGDAVAACRKAPRKRSARARADARDDADFVDHDFLRFSG